MDTAGRTTLNLVAHNAVEEWRDWGNVIVTYDYPYLAQFRKPISISLLVFTLFFIAWLVGNLEVKIGKGPVAKSVKRS